MEPERASLEDLITAAREAEPGDRIGLCDAIAEFGEEAIDAMRDLLADRRLAAFVIRVLERVGQQPEQRDAAVSALVAADRTGWPHYLTDDLDRSLSTLGYRRSTGRQMARPRTDRPQGLPGQPGRGYWVMRTSPWERPHLWAEAQEGRLRQGWGVDDEQDLNVIADKRRRGEELSGLQLEAVGAIRMLASWHNGMHLGDIVVAPNLPQYGRLSVFRILGSYYWSPGPAYTWGERFGHVLPVELLAADVARHGPQVSDGLRAALRGQTRMYNINGYGGDVEGLIGGEVGMDRHGEQWTEADYETLFGQFPATGDRPTEAEIDELAIELGRSPDAVSWQWNDGAAYVQGRSASTTSDVLKQWLDRER